MIASALADLTCVLPQGQIAGDPGLCGQDAKLFDNQLLSYKQAARYLSISEPYLRRLKAQGQIPYVQLGLRGIRFRVSSLNQWIEKREIK